MGVALAAAYMLVLQALIGSFALGAAAAAPMLDAFGHPLCVSGASAAQAAPAGGDHDALPECCAGACCVFAPATADERAPRSLSNPLEAGVREPALSSRDAGPAPAFERGPGSPRSPPAASA